MSLYYESHITLDPVFDDRLEQLKQACLAVVAREPRPERVTVPFGGPIHSVAHPKNLTYNAPLWISGGRGRSGKKAKPTPVPPGIKVCSAQQRRRTPPAFAEWLISLAATAPVESEEGG